jgi:hypothetical protein
METLDRLYQNLQILFWESLDLISAYLLQIEIWLRQPLYHAGLSFKLQIICLICLCLILVLLAMRAFGGLIRAAMLIVVAALFVHLVTTQVHFFS